MKLLTTAEIQLRYADLLERYGMKADADWIREFVARNY